MITLYQRLISGFRKTAQQQNYQCLTQLINQNIHMYNLHQYNQTVKHQELDKNREERYAKYLLKHQEFKDASAQKQLQKLSLFLSQDHASKFVFEDDHFKQWRHLKLFRDVENKTKFLGFKTFRHKPNYEMGRAFDERERKEAEYLALKKDGLIKSSIIPEAQRRRNLRCQGPLNPPIEFRSKIANHEFLQPRLRFTNITDRERMNETSMSYDDKFQSLYKSFQLTKSKIGSPSKKMRYQHNEDREVLGFMSETQSQIRSQLDPIEPMQQEIMNEEQNRENKVVGQLSKTKMTESKRSKNKTYYKLAKVVQLKSPRDSPQHRSIEKLMKQTQFERRKDMTNINGNNSCESYRKAPIL